MSLDYESLLMILGGLFSLVVPMLYLRAGVRSGKIAMKHDYFYSAGAHILVGLLWGLIFMLFEPIPRVGVSDSLLTPFREPKLFFMMAFGYFTMPYLLFVSWWAIPLTALVMRHSRGKMSKSQGVGNL